MKASVDSWLDYDFFRFQAEQGRLYHIVVSDERGYYKAGRHPLHAVRPRRGNAGIDSFLE